MTTKVNLTEDCPIASFYFRGWHVSVGYGNQFLVVNDRLQIETKTNKEIDDCKVFFKAVKGNQTQMRESVTFKRDCVKATSLLVEMLNENLN